jgi:hypothetical protein
MPYEKERFNYNYSPIFLSFCKVGPSILNYVVLVTQSNILSKKLMMWYVLNDMVYNLMMKKYQHLINL